MTSLTPSQVCQNWCDKFQVALDNKDVAGLTALFCDDGWWRDQLNITFDFNSLTRDTIPAYLERFGIPTLNNLCVVRPDDAVDVNGWTQCFLSYETPTMRGKGFLRLRESVVGSGELLAYTFFTTIWEVKGHEERSHGRRPFGTLHGEKDDKRNWMDHREEQQEFTHADPAVLIIGAGQNGLMLAARLIQVGIPALLVEKNPRIGDSWRNRYHSLVLHDPIYSDHFPYLPYPDNYPVYIPKNKLANWFEHYAEAMELNVWTESTMQRNPVYDSATRKWTVKIDRAGVTRVMRVNHIVLATGGSGEPKYPSFPRDEFEGTVVHSSAHKGGKEWAGKKAVVVGCCNSGHDISADLYECGADTTIIQRSSTYVMSSEHGINGLLKGFYEEGGPPTEDADLMFSSLPSNLLFAFHTAATTDIAIKDKEILDGLTAAGFKLDRHPEGLFHKFYKYGGGYYIDVGASGLIAEKKIKIKQGQEITKLTKNGILFADGVELPADIIVLATGYDSMRTTVGRLVSQDIADRMGSPWGLDKQGELNGVWRNTGVEGFWIQCGNFTTARIWSKHLAMQLQMIELGLAKKDTPFPVEKVDPACTF